MLQHEWHIQSPVDLPTDLLALVNQDRIAAEYLTRRGITSPGQVKKYLEPDRDNLADPFDLPDMSIAVARILQALDSNEVIGIWGDFDVDGQTSTAILVECLTKLDAKIHYYLPVRGKESHGIAIPSLQEFLKKGIQLLITCDTGITAHEAVLYSNSRKVDVIISDHHTLPEELPPALACIDPRRLPDEHPLATLSGSGTAFELMLAVCRQRDQEEVAFQSIDLAALGLIADLASLQNDARLITQLGLKRMALQPRAWIQALMTAANIKSYVMDEQTVGYLIAPRLNAFGRLDDANPLVRFLMDADPSEIPGIAQKLERLNADRRWLSNQVGQSALEQYNRQRELWDDPVTILTNPAWPGGVLGLAASKLVAETNRPAILLNESSEGLLRGSARSVEGINITEAIASAGHLLQGFGGHPMAAGMSLPSENLMDFRRSINNWVKDKGLAILKPPPIEIDAEVQIRELTPEFYTNLQRLAPFGVGNPPITFCTRSIHIASSKALGRSKEHFRFVLVNQSGMTIPAIWWNADTENIPTGEFDLVFTLRENHFQGETTLQVEWIDFHILEESEIPLDTTTGLEIVDLRSSSHPIEEARKTFSSEGIQIFQEPPPIEHDEVIGRLHLHPQETLVLASLPPSIGIMEKVIQKCHPKTVILAFDAPSQTSPLVFIKHLSGLIQYAVTSRDGLANINDLAEATNTRLETIEVGLAWLVSAGKIIISSRDQDLVELLIQNTPENTVAKIEMEKTLDYILKETFSFQKYLYAMTIKDFSNFLSGFLKPLISNTKKTNNHPN